MYLHSGAGWSGVEEEEIRGLVRIPFPHLHSGQFRSNRLVKLYRCKRCCGGGGGGGVQIRSMAHRHFYRRYQVLYHLSTVSV